jgi:hypothetical protein
MNRRIGRLLLMGWLLLLLAPGLPVGAQGGTLSADAFWERLQTTLDKLEQSDPVGAAALWENVRRIDVQGTVIEIDLSWLRTALAAKDASTLQKLRSTLRAMLNFHAQRGAASESRLSLAALQALLQEPRFQYADATPTSVPRIDLPSLPFSVDAAQLMLLMAGGAVVALVLISLVRLLRVQPAKLPNAASPADDPVTAADARRLAEARAETRDYRSAIRYLYLSTLLALDERGVIHYDATLTNREHLAQVQGKPALKEPLRRLVTIFDDVWYGYAAVDEALYTSYRSQVQQLWQSVS